jgi:ATP/maltotriose-dependent transcriptional regulator MalT
MNCMAYLIPLIALAAGGVQAARGEMEQTLAQYKRAEEQALAMEMRPSVWQARAGAAQVLVASGRGEAAQAKRQAAMQVVEEIVGLFQDKTLQAGFHASALERIGLVSA